MDECKPLPSFHAASMTLSARAVQRQQWRCSAAAASGSAASADPGGAAPLISTTTSGRLKFDKYVKPLSSLAT